MKERPKSSIPYLFDRNRRISNVSGISNEVSFKNINSG